MDCKSENIFLKSRMAAGAINPNLCNRGIAAEMLNVSYDSLFNYESGKTVPNEDMVFAMAELYQDQMLIVEYFKQSRIGQFMQQKFGLDYQIGELSRAAIGFIDGALNIEIKKLTAIVKDGVISEDELQDANLIKENVKELTGQGYRLLWELCEAEANLKKSPEKTKTVGQDGNRRRKTLRCAV